MLETSNTLKKPISPLWVTAGYLILIFTLALAGYALWSDRYTTFVTIFLSIAIEAIPFLLIGSIVSGCIHIFVDQQLLIRFTPRHPLLGAFFGAALGLLFPVCECGVIPVIRRLYQKGLPLSVGIAFMLAAPVVNPIVIASTYAAFGWGPIMAWRLGVSFLIAGGIGLLFSYARPEEVLLPEIRKSGETHPQHGSCCENTSEQTCAAAHSEARSRPPWRTRVYEALAVAGDDFLDMIRYVLLGAIVAAGLQTLVSQTMFLQLRSNTMTSILTMMLLAFVLSVCSTADAFLALAFTNTFPRAAILAFLVFGPMIDIKSTLMLLRVFHLRSILYIILLTAMLTLTGTLLLNLQGGW